MLIYDPLFNEFLINSNCLLTLNLLHILLKSHKQTVSHSSIVQALEDWICQIIAASWSCSLCGFVTNLNVLRRESLTISFDARDFVLAWRNLCLSTDLNFRLINWVGCMLILTIHQHLVHVLLAIHTHVICFTVTTIQIFCFWKRLFILGRGRLSLDNSSSMVAGAILLWVYSLYGTMGNLLSFCPETFIFFNADTTTNRSNTVRSIRTVIKFCFL